jgi:flagellar motor switch protein FliN
MTQTTDAQTKRILTLAVDAAEAALELLPASSPLLTGTPDAGGQPIPVAGQAIRARFTGAAQGEIVVVVAPDLVEALADTPLGALDVTQAVRPALEAAAGTLGPVVVDPGTVMPPAQALAAVISAGGVQVPLADTAGTVRGVLALAVAGAGAVRDGAAPVAGGGNRGGLEMLHDVEMEVTAELGRTRMSVRDLLGLIPGTVIELDRVAGGPADLLVNGRLIARGEVVVIDENFGIRITEILSRSGDRA